jgi:plastocyanin
MIEAQANEAINSPRNRLEIADEFDEVIAALVSQLMSVALSEVTEQGNTEYTNEEIDVGEEDDNNNGGEPVDEPGNGANGFTPGPLPQITGVCRVSTTTIAVDEKIEFTVAAKGGNKIYKYDWLGSDDFPTSTTQFRLLARFTTTTVESDIRVRIKSAGKQAVVKCPTVTVTPPIPLEVSCKPDDVRVNVGDQVTWYSEVSGGNGEYEYEWMGDVDVYDENDAENTITYRNDGRYNASLKVISGTQSKTVSCDSTVRVRD